MHTRASLKSFTGAWLLYILAFSCLASGRSDAVFTAAHVHSRTSGKGPSLIQALQNSSVTHIIIVPDHLDIAAELEGYPAKFRLDRNVTVSGAKGTDTTLDQQFQRARLQLCGNCTWTYSNITIANDTRSSTPGNELFVAAELGAKVVLQDANVLRLACPSAVDALGVLSITPRSAAFKDGALQQRYSTRDISVQGTLYPAALFAQDFSTDVPPSQEGRSNTGGYALLWRNTGRPCTAYVPTSCLDSKSMDACTKDLTEALLAEGQAVRGDGGLGPAALAAAVAVPVCVVALAAAGVGVWCWRGKRAPESPKTFARRKRSLPDDISELESAADVETGSGGPNTEPDGSGGPIRADGQPLRRPLGLQAGWTVAKACTSPYLGPVEDDRIEFGVLIGSGSFGRVYQAKWAGRDVAVKVIEHNTDTTVPVEREVTLMLSFNHPNIVRAFHFVTRVYSSEVMPHNPSKDNELTKGSSAGSRPGVALSTPASTPKEAIAQANMSLAAAAGNPHAAAVVAAAAAAGKAGSNNSRSSGPGPVVRALPPLPPSAGHASSNNTGGSGNSRCSAGGSSDKPSGGGSVSNPQLQLVQRLPSLTGGTPRLVHKVETWLVQEYCDCGTLASVATEWKHEPETDQKMLERLQLLQDCAKGLKELHSRNVVHGDLNARNVLLSSSGVTSLGVVAKLADLGLSRIVRSHRSHHSTNTVGTMSHVAPELLRYGHMSTAGDIYAFAIMMWELFTGQAAFRKLHVGQFFEAIVVRNLRPIIPRGMAADYQLLMQSCWSASPNDRPSVERLLNCIKLMIDVRQTRLNTPGAAAAAAAAGPGSPHMCLQHPLPAETAAAELGPGGFSTNSAPLPSVAVPHVGTAVLPSDAALLMQLTQSPQQQQQQQQHHHHHQQQQLRMNQLGPFHASAAAGGAPAAAASGSPRMPQASAYSVSSGSAGASAAASALPGLLSLLKERGPSMHMQQQQQLLHDMAGGRLHSSCPQERRFTRSAAAAIIGDDMPHLTPINTGRRSSNAESVGPIPVGYSQSDPLPAQGARQFCLQQQILMQLQQQSTERSSGSFHGFPEASGSSTGSGGMPTPLLRGYHPTPAGATMVTPITGVKYQYTSAGGGGGSNSGLTGGLPASSLSQPLPSGSSSTSQRRASMGSLGSPSGPLRLPGTASLARTGSLGTSSRHWYWQRTPAAPDRLEGGGEEDEDDVRSVSDQDGPADKVDEVQPGCPDVMAQVQMDNNWYV